MGFPIFFSGAAVENIQVVCFLLFIISFHCIATEYRFYGNIILFNINNIDYFENTLMEISLKYAELGY